MREYGKIFDRIILQNIYKRKIMLVLTKNFRIILGVCILFTLAAALPGEIFLFGIIGVLSVVFLVLAIENRKHLFFPKLVIVLLLFQNTMIGLGAHYGLSDLSYISYLTQIPTMCIFIGGIVDLFRKKTDKIDVLAFFMMVLLFVSCFFGTGTFISKVIYARNYLCFYMAYLIGKQNMIRKSDLEEMIQFYILLSEVAAIFGIIAMILGKPFYTAIGMNEVTMAKNAVLSDGMPGYFLTKIFDKWVYRLGSFYYEPVNFSYFVALGSILSFLSYINNKTWTNVRRFFIIFLGTVLTFGKSGILIMIIGLCLIFLEGFLHKVRKAFGKARARRLLLVGMLTVLISGMVFVSEFVINQFGSIAHYDGLFRGIESMFRNPWGYGLGSVGNIASARGIRNLVGETGLLVMGVQIGIQGIILLIWIMLSISKEVNKNTHSERKIRQLYMLFTYMPIILLLFFALQENTFTPQCITGYMLFAGGLSNRL